MERSLPPEAGDPRKRSRTYGDNIDRAELVDFLKQELEYAKREKKEIKEDADRRIAEIKKDAKEAIAAANERTKEANERTKEANERTKEAIAAGDRRLESFYKFARKTVNDLNYNARPVLEQTERALRDQKSITYGCRGRILMSDSSIEFDFVEGTEEHTSIEVAVPTERYVRSREVKIARAVTDYKSVADPTDVITNCIERVQDKWKTQKSSFSVKRRRTTYVPP